MFFLEHVSGDHENTKREEIEPAKYLVPVHTDIF